MTRQTLGINHIARSDLLPLFIISIAACVPTITFAGSVSSAQSAGQMQQMQGKESSQGPAIITCSVREVGVLENRIHVLCNNSQGKVRYFAAGSKDVNADRYIALATAAKSRNQNVTIHFDAKSAANPSGCLAKDCRKITAMFW
jgi:hypothetical protein